MILQLHVVSCNTKLQEIDISENNLHTAGVQKIMKALQEINTLKNYALVITILLVKQQMILQLLFPVILI